MQNSKLVLLGASHFFRLFVAIYRLQPNENVVLVDLDKSTHGQDIDGFKVVNPEDVEINSTTISICFSPLKGVLFSDEDNFPEEFVFYSQLGLSRDRIAFLHEPGSVHRFISLFYQFDDEMLMRIGNDTIYHNLFQRNNYAYGIQLATEVAIRTRISSITIVETGVWFGAGLLNLCQICDFLNQTKKIHFNIFGFDTGEGLPQPQDWRDHPELWASGSMKMPDTDSLKRRLPNNCQLILGDVANTIPEFIKNNLSKESPLGFISLDVDLYTASVSVLKLLDAESVKLLPVIPVWVDDSYINITQTNFAGEALAIEDFNKLHDRRKIDRKIVRTTRPQDLWHHCYYFAHIFDHPLRNGVMPGSLAGLFHTSY